mgnify:CR=1 FL=1
MESTPVWLKLKEDERKSILKSVGDLEKQTNADLGGLRDLINHEYELGHRLGSIKQDAEKLAKTRTPPPKDQSTPIAAPRRFEKSAEIDEFIKRIEALKEKLPVDVDWQQG